MSKQATPSPVAEELVQTVLQAVLENAPLPLAQVAGPEHVVWAINPAFCTLLSRSAEELIGQPFADLFPQSTRSSELLDRVLRSGVGEAFVIVEGQAANSHYGAFTCWPINAGIGRLSGLMIQVTETTVLQQLSVAVNEALLISSVEQHELADVADRLNVRLHDEMVVREELDAALRESQRFLRSSLDALSGHLAVVDASGTILEVNEAWHRFASENGYPTADHGIGSKYLQELTIPDELGPEYARGINNVLAGKQNSFEFEYPCHSPTAQRWFLMRVTRFTTPGPVRVLIVHDNITERKQAELALRESEAFNRSITNSSPDCIKILDLDGKLLSMAERGQKLLCIPDITPYLNAPWVDFYQGEEDRSAATAAVQKAAAGDEGNFIGFFATLDGTPKWWDVRISPIRDASGKPVKLLAVSRDITERKQAEMNLAFLASISKDLLHLANIDELMGVVGQKIGAYLGLSVCAFVEIHEGGDQAVVTHDWQREQGPSFVGVHRMEDFFTPEFQAAGHAGETFVVSDAATDPRASGSNFAAFNVAALITVPLLQDGAWRFMLCAYHSQAHPWRADEVELTQELTARIWTRLESLRAEATVREMDDRLRLALDSAQLGTWNLDPATGLFTVDARYQTIFGTTGSALLLEEGTNSVHPDDRDRVANAVEQAMRPDGNTQVEIEYRIVHPDGSAHWVLSKGRTVFDHKGGAPTLMGFAGTVADITERKQLELALEQTAKDLAEVDRRKSEFLATLAHELRNPLAPLRNGLELLSMADHDRATWDQAHGMMKRQLDQMVRLIDELMDLSRISRGTVDLRLERADLRTVLNQAVEACRPLIERQDHTLVVDIPDEPVMIEGDGMRLTQVFSNLLNNAAKYTDNGGAIAVRLDMKGNEARVTIDDNGIGIAANQLGKVFDMFAQVERANDRVQGGLGIGLNIVKHLVGMHGGRIAVNSDGLGKGSSFTVHLPIGAEPQQEAAVVGAAVAVKAISPQRILIVDDNMDAAAMMALLMGRMGHELRVANNGEEALAVGAELLPDVVLMDLGMPVMDGFTACRMMRKTAWGTKALIVALSGWGQDEDRVKSKEAGFDHHLVKPIGSAAFVEVIAEARRTGGSGRSW